jgi:putative transposase
MVDRPENYRWSSYRATAGLEKAPDWLDTTAAYRQFGPDVVTAQTQYRDFVAERLDNHDSPWDHLTNGIYLGSEAWVKQMRAIVESRPRSTDHPKEQRAVGRPQMPAVIAAVAEIAGEPAAAIRSRGGSQSRRLAAWLGWHEGLLTLRSIAASLRLRSEGYVSGMIRRCEIEFGLDQTLLAHLDRAIAVLRV